MYKPWRDGAEWSWRPRPQHKGTVGLERWHWPLTLWPWRLRQSPGHGQRRARTDESVERADGHSDSKVCESRSRRFRHRWHHWLHCQHQHAVVKWQIVVVSYGCFSSLCAKTIRKGVTSFKPHIKADITTDNDICSDVHYTKRSAVKPGAQGD